MMARTAFAVGLLLGSLFAFNLKWSLPPAAAHRSPPPSAAQSAERPRLDERPQLTQHASLADRVADWSADGCVVADRTFQYTRDDSSIGEAAHDDNGQDLDVERYVPRRRFHLANYWDDLSKVWNALGAAEKSTASPTPERQPEKPEVTALRKKIDTALAIYRPRHLNTRDHSPWEILHSIVAFGVDTQVRMDSPTGEPVTAIGWLCFNRRARGLNLLYLSGDSLGVQKGPGLQGHYGQLLSYLAQTRLKEDYPLYVGGKQFTIRDLVEHEKRTCRANTELTFQLTGLAHYLDSDATWLDDMGQTWTIQRMIREELAQPIRGATCGGTHRLFGLSYAVRQRARQGKPMLGEFWRAKTFINDYQAYAFSLQNADGSFSTEWFSGRGASPDVERRLQTSGHILEWLTFSLPQGDLTEPRTIKAVDYLAQILIDGKDRTWPMGPLGHALHALVIYQERLTSESAETEISPTVADGERIKTARRPSKPGTVSVP